MTTTHTHISRIKSRLSAGLHILPIPSPTALLLSLVLGPAMLMALHPVHYYAA